MKAVQLFSTHLLRRPSTNTVVYRNAVLSMCACVHNGIQCLSSRRSFHRKSLDQQDDDDDTNHFSSDSSGYQPRNLQENSFSTIFGQQERQSRHSSKYSFPKDYGQQEHQPRRSSRYGFSSSSFSQVSSRHDNSDFWDFESVVDFEPILSKSFKKDLYKPHPDTTNRPQEEIDNFMKKNDLRISGTKKHRPIFSFHEIDLPEQIQKKLERVNITIPTVIQSVGLPVALSGRNLVGIAQTGSGKTLSFMLPAVLHLKEQPKLQYSVASPVVVVLCPTRELAKQNRKVAQSLNDGNLRIACFYGGSDKHQQYEQIRYGCDILIATPGRLIDFIKQDKVDLRRCTFFVLDEADTMLDMGFAPQIRKIADQIRPDRQMTMWSATWPKEIQHLAREYLSNADSETVYMKVGSTDLTANRDIEQKFHVCRNDSKSNLILPLVQKLSGMSGEEHALSRDDKRVLPKILIFVNTKRGCDSLERILRRGRIRCQATHGNKPQNHRERTLKDFRMGNLQVLIATNVAARGIDVKDIDCVINYDCPADCVTYVHRIGRTGRAGRRGVSHTFLTEVDGGVAGDIIKTLEAVDHPVDPVLQKLLRWHRSNKHSRHRYR